MVGDLQTHANLHSPVRAGQTPVIPSDRVQIWLSLFLYGWYYPGVRLQIWVCLICVSLTYSNGAVQIRVGLELAEMNSIRRFSPSKIGGVLHQEPHYRIFRLFRSFFVGYSGKPSLATCWPGMKVRRANSKTKKPRNHRLVQNPSLATHTPLMKGVKVHLLNKGVWILRVAYQASRFP